MSAAARIKPYVNVAVAVVQRADGRVLLAKRPRGKASAGYWEFPGGKFEIAEDARTALARELREETGVELDLAYRWMTYEHEYADKFVRLHVYRVLNWHGAPHGREGQRVSWEDPAGPAVAPLLPANDRVMRALSLPPLYAITRASHFGIPDFMQRLDAGLRAGLRLIQVRESELAPEQLAQFARRIVSLAHRYGAKVMVNGDFAAARRSGADGVHLTARQLQRMESPPPFELWSASCHNADELARAAQLHANFVVLSQVLPTSSHPGKPGMGWARFEELTRTYPLPVYALGGMRLDRLDAAMQHGAHGIALMGGVW
jgi:8-oxo-dGTP diphosphatase